MADDIPSLAAGKITSGTFDAARIPGLSTDKLTSGTLGVARGGTGATTFTSGAALIGNGANAITTRSITNNTTVTAVTASTNLITANTLYYHTGNSNITTVGTISSGTWQGTAIAAAYIGNHSTDKLNSGTLGVARGGTGNTTGTATYCTTTNDTSNTLYLVGVTSGATTTLKRDTSITMVGGTLTATKVLGAVWNDYAEYRSSSETAPGRVVTETYTGQMELASQRLMPGCRIISDTYGFVIGESESARVPIAVCGRVLVYPYKPREQYHLGDAVCSAPNGTIDIMSREEIQQFPDRIIGTVSEIPTYEVWQAGNKDNPTPINVDGRIWVYVR